MHAKLFVAFLGVGVCIALLGCGSGAGDGVSHNQHPEPGLDQPDQHAHDHPTEGPHGGHLIELGRGEYHGELTHDESARSVTVHLLDATGTKPAAAGPSSIVLRLFQDGQFVDYTLQPSEQPSAASEFSTENKALCDLLEGHELRGRLEVAIAGKQYTGIIEHHAHDQEGGDLEAGDQGDRQHDEHSHDEG